jgi:hypothetical protein
MSDHEYWFSGAYFNDSIKSYRLCNYQSPLTYLIGTMVSELELSIEKMHKNQIQ